MTRSVGHYQHMILHHLDTPKTEEELAKLVVIETDHKLIWSIRGLELRRYIKKVGGKYERDIKGQDWCRDHPGLQGPARRNSDVAV